MLKKFIISFLFLPLSAFGSVPRIERKSFDLSKVRTHYIAPNMASIIEFPDPVHDFVIGNNEAITVLNHKVKQNTLVVGLKREAKGPTNLIVMAGKRFYVLDIVPSRALHKDRYRIPKSFGGPKDIQSEELVIDSSTTKDKKKNENKNFVVIDSSRLPAEKKKSQSINRTKSKKEDIYDASYLEEK